MRNLAPQSPSAEAVAPSDATSTEPTSLPSLRIAVVEDNADVRTCLKTLLEMEGNEVRVAGDGIEGTDLILSWCPDVAIVDIGLPGKDGFCVAKEVREQHSVESRQPLPYLIALTGYGLPSDRLKVLEAGYQVHLVKPVNLEELAAVLHRLARSQLAQNRS